MQERFPNTRYAELTFYLLPMLQRSWNITPSIRRSLSLETSHILSATVAVGFTKLLKINAPFESLRWLAGALRRGLASALMIFINTVYPAAGATSLLVAVDPQVERLGWYLLPLILPSRALTY